MSYKGKYKIKNPDKYLGNPTKVIFRSLWERNAFRWCENNPNIRAWSSEEIVVPYKCSVDNRLHRYFVDLYLEMKDGKTFLIEIKPKKETQPPKTEGREPGLISRVPKKEFFDEFDIEIYSTAVLLLPMEAKGVVGGFACMHGNKLCPVLAFFLVFPSFVHFPA